MRILLDTNVLFDLIARREPFYHDALRLQVMEVFGDAELWVSAQSFADVFYVMRKTHSSDRIQTAFLESMTFLNVCGVEKRDIEEASRSAWTDFEDCLISVCAEKVKAHYILTRDKNGFGESKLSSTSPQEFFSQLEQEHGLVYDVEPLL